MIAIPHNVGWWHEIVNLDVGGRQIAVTYCPLTGSGIAFDRSDVGGAEFGVSGLLFQNNLVMYDRRTEESLWPQMLRQGACGPSASAQLSLYSVVEMTWEGWHTLHPETTVIGEPARSTTYNTYPYGNYEELNNSNTLFPMPLGIDSRRPPKERVLGIVGKSKGGIAFPFGALQSAGSLVAADAGLHNGRPVVVFWDESRQAAAAFYTTVGDEVLQFTVEDRQIVDLGTRSVWQVGGGALEGPLAGQRLEPVAEAYVAFWFAWAAFQPDGVIWAPEL